MNTPLTFVARSTDDTMQADFDFEVEPASMQLERLFHAPAHGEY